MQFNKRKIFKHSKELIEDKIVLKRRKFIKSSLLITAGSFFLLPMTNRSDEVRAATPTLKPNPSKWKDEEISISWIGHSTVLINFYGKIILTDPVMFRRVGINVFGVVMGPSRFTAPALSFDEMPKPDLILLSHAHMDHMDYKSLERFTSKFPNEINCITAFNTMDVIQDLKWKSLREMDWGETISSLGINFKAVQVKHFGWRYPWERDRSKGYFHIGRSYNAYVLERNGSKILFGGDTALTDAFKISGESVDIAIMPVGAYEPWRMNHCNPEEALKMANDVNAKIFIPIHTDTFKQGMEPLDEALLWVQNSFSKYDLELGIEQIGDTYQTA